MRLEGKIALVTGAGSGIGQALAEELNARGAHLLLVGRREAALDATRRGLIRPEAGQIVVADITTDAGRAELVRRVARLGGLDLLVNNAGLVMSGAFQTDDAQARRRMVETNLLAPMELTQALLPLLRERARIVNIGSMFGDIAFPYFAGYSATKFGLRGWSDALRRELAPHGIGVTYAAPRGTRTPAAHSFAALAEAFDMRFDPPARIALRLVRAIEADARSVYPPTLDRLFVLIQRLLPGLIDRALSGRVARADETLIQGEAGFSRR